jgi:hypothetical protein
VQAIKAGLAGNLKSVADLVEYWYDFERRIEMIVADISA